MSNIRYQRTHYGRYVNYYSRERNRILANASIGRVDAEVCLESEKVTWGILNKHYGDLEIGILYMKIQFTQSTENFGLKSTEIMIEFDTPAEPEQGPFVEHVAPPSMVGEPSGHIYRTNFTANPSVQVAGQGGSLGSASREREGERKSRWTFTARPKADTRGEYTKVFLQWNAQEFGSEVFFNRPIHTAAVVQHQKAAFDMSCTIELFPVSWRSRLEKLFIARPRRCILRDVCTDGSAVNLSVKVSELNKEIEDENERQAPRGELLQKGNWVIQLMCKLA